jgi:hypothetical protein
MWNSKTLIPLGTLAPLFHVKSNLLMNLKPRLYMWSCYNSGRLLEPSFRGTPSSSEQLLRITSLCAASLTNESEPVVPNWHRRAYPTHLRSPSVLCYLRHPLTSSRPPKRSFVILRSFKLSIDVSVQSHASILMMS